MILHGLRDDVDESDLHHLLRDAFLMIVRYVDKRREADEALCALADALSTFVIYVERRYSLKTHS